MYIKAFDEVNFNTLTKMIRLTFNLRKAFPLQLIRAAHSNTFLFDFEPFNVIFVFQI